MVKGRYQFSDQYGQGRKRRINRQEHKKTGLVIYFLQKLVADFKILTGLRV